jgi:hypothetical protein
MFSEKLGCGVSASVKIAVICIGITFMRSFIHIGLLAIRERDENVMIPYNKVRVVGCCKMNPSEVVLAEMLKVFKPCHLESSA